MQTTLPLVLLFGGLGAAQMNIACNSFGISDGYQNHQTWRARDEHCQGAIDNLGPNFGQKVPSSEHGCTVLAEDQTCEVRICDDYNVRRTVSYETVWAAANVVHARHRGGGTVAGYVSLDDYTLGGNLFRTFIMVAAKDSPDPSGKRKRGSPGSLFGRRSLLDDQDQEASPANATEQLQHMLQVRTSDAHEFDLSEVSIPNTDGLNVNVQAGWGDLEWAPNDQMQNAMENLLVMWNNNGGDGASSLRPAGYLAPGNIMIEFEWSAHQFQPAGAIRYEERAELLRHLINMRGWQGNYGNYVAQIRRGTQNLGHAVIRVFRLVADQTVGRICG
ncbi:hypothetical protein DL765_004927 [Monosporascus sp. GIB2]|nr:hypothetical protein DL765_004927 [Monosporascus sp. GIB2]